MMSIPLDVVHDPEDPRQALPFLQLAVDGHPYRALLDSGAALTSIAAPPGTVTRPGGRTGRSAFGAPIRHRLWRAAIDVGGARLGDFDVADQPHADRFLLGQDVLSQFRCHYRLVEGELVLDGPEPEHALPIRLDPGRHVSLTASWTSGETADVVFDTGASVTVVDAGFATRHPGLFAARGTDAGSDASGETRQAELVEIAGPTILGHRFAPSLAVIVDLTGANADLPWPMDVILGWPLVSQVDWVIDHPRARAAVLPRGVPREDGAPRR
ncbi:hypothetical protein [Isoptericola sp. NPDC057191]|uniref:hypothetical protein n=1 Tax=Isoptericola sp. NPDC057191 TaxID=3346041 RepID=UPI00363C06FF